MTYRHKRTGLVLTLAWETPKEVGLNGGGFTWTGTREAFEGLWEAI